MIAADLDEAVLSNRASDKRLLFENSVVRLLARADRCSRGDFVLEHRSLQMIRVLNSFCLEGWRMVARGHHINILRCVVIRLC